MSSPVSCSPPCPLKSSLEAADRLADDPEGIEWDFRKLVNSPYFSDVTFIVGSERMQFSAHRPILAARSTYFRAMSPISTPISLEVPSISPASFKVFLEFLYTNALKYLDGERAADLFALGRMYQVPALEMYKWMLAKGKSSTMMCLPSLGTEMEKILFAKEHSDVTFLVEDERFVASRAVLSARSTYFSSLLCGNWREVQEREIALKGVSPDSFARVLRYIYTDRADTPDLSTTLDLMHLSQYYGLSGLQEACERYFIDNLTPTTVCETWSFAQSEEMTHTASACLRFFRRNFGAVSRTASFAALPRTLLKDALATGEIVEDSDTVLGAVMRWGAANCPAGEDLRHFLKDLLPPETLFNAHNKMYLLGLRGNLWMI